MMARLFTALEIPPEIALDLDMMRGGIAGARWIDRENYHITLRFMGEVDGATYRELRAALDGVRGAPLRMALRGVGSFGGRKPHSLWAGVAENPALRELQMAQERLCQQLGLAPEPRKFFPHVTIARLRQARVGDVETYILGHSLYQSPLFETGRFVLMSSRPSRGGGPYALEETYPL
jgi:2'-5' RNA ligase